MKRFDIIKTIQLLLLIAAAAAAFLLILRDEELYRMLAENGHIRALGFLLWAVLGVSFAFLFYDFNSYSDLKRENMELDNAIYSDALTGIANRYSVDVYIGKYLDRPLPPDMGCVTLQLEGLEKINEVSGHSGGDAAIQDFSEILQQASSGVCFIGRNGGNKFVAIFRDCTHSRIRSFLEEIDRLLAERNEKHPDAALGCSRGSAFDEGEAVSSLTGLIALSDKRCRQSAAGGGDSRG